MGEFLVLLAAYYLCDATAAIRPMSQGEVAACMETYDDVKAWFAPGFELAPEGTLDRFEQMSAAYLAFQDWQAANPDLVGRMRTEAWHRALGRLPTPG